MAALVVPLLAQTPAQAAPAADLRIAKTVARLTPPLTFEPSLSDTRTKGHYEWRADGLHIWTEGATSQDKVAEYVATSSPLAEVGEPSLGYTKIAPNPSDPLNNVPGFQLVTDFDSDGYPDGILVGERIYGTDWWLSNGSSQWVKDLAPSHTGGSGSANHGTLDQWRAAFPNATVVAFGFSLGSGVQGEGVITALNFADTGYDVGRPHLGLNYQSSVKAAPGETVEYRIKVSNRGDAGATDTTVTDTLPDDLTYVPGSLRYSGSSWCSVTGQALSCQGGSLAAGSSTSVYFQATISDTVNTDGLGSSVGHHVDVQKQEVFADLPAGKTRTYTALCPAGYVATDGGLLLDAIDQGGYYDEIVISRSTPTTVGGVDGWTVTASNMGESRGQGKVKVTCLDGTVGTVNGHTHDLVTIHSVGNGTIAATSTNATGERVTRSCLPGYTPIAPRFEVTSGIAVVRTSKAVGSAWTWVVDHEPGTAANFDVDCLAPETTSASNHTTTLPLATSTHTISVGSESRGEGVEHCTGNARAIVGGYAGEDASVLSLGKEPRGDNYMFRFYNSDWDSWHADIQVTCVAVRTPDEAQYYHITNTATVHSPDDPSDSSSSADVSVRGAAVQPGGGVAVNPTASRTGGAGSIKKVTLGITCTSACAFTVKVFKGSTLVAKATKALGASPDPRFVAVPTVSAGRTLAQNDVVTVKVTTSTGTTSTTVTLL
ncbi:hypothetical protein GCM10009606_39010 [Nocardioides aquiterrae]|uniref:DUF11 domain-containing protein n=1 Tax=Nocardioides aquiterrae TaxID=203799 RepID=A0ABN1ULI5_9ACTN